ncbi:MAG TPA: hypothetical protein VNN07_02155 [Candidatus Tectomicrobia bacterium]|nr:hypothetical protein [Candidatus Tectomicrobia bacterium]
MSNARVTPAGPRTEGLRLSDVELVMPEGSSEAVLAGNSLGGLLRMGGVTELASRLEGLASLIGEDRHGLNAAETIFVRGALMDLSNALTDDDDLENRPGYAHRWEIRRLNRTPKAEVA